MLFTAIKAGVCGRKYFVNLFFYHRVLKALVALDLKVGPFELERAGKKDLDLYLNLLNDRESGLGDQPSMGIWTGIIFHSEADPNLYLVFYLQTTIYVGWETSI
jgi:hypothetical protein